MCKYVWQNIYRCICSTFSLAPLLAPFYRLFTVNQPLFYRQSTLFLPSYSFTGTFTRTFRGTYRDILSSQMVLITCDIFYDIICDIFQHHFHLLRYFRFLVFFSSATPSCALLSLVWVGLYICPIN